jgi:DNA-directed RNA polymerase subunit RPC12/RpoP
MVVSARNAGWSVCSWGRLSRLALHGCTLALLVVVIASFDRRWSSISDNTLPKRSAEQAYIVRLESARVAVGSYPSDVVFRGLIDHGMWCGNCIDAFGVPPKEEKPNIHIAHELEGDWCSLPIFRRISLGQSSLTYFEFPLVYALVPMLIVSVVLAVRDVRRYIRSRRQGCRRCGYALEGLTSNTCPECGSTIVMNQ